VQDPVEVGIGSPSLLNDRFRILLLSLPLCYAYLGLMIRFIGALQWVYSPWGWGHSPKC